MCVTKKSWRTAAWTVRVGIVNVPDDYGIIVINNFLWHHCAFSVGNRCLGSFKNCFKTFDIFRFCNSFNQKVLQFFRDIHRQTVNCQMWINELLRNQICNGEYLFIQIDTLIYWFIKFKRSLQLFICGPILLILFITPIKRHCQQRLHFQISYRPKSIFFPATKQLLYRRAALIADIDMKFTKPFGNGSPPCNPGWKSWKNLENRTWRVRPPPRATIITAFKSKPEWSSHNPPSPSAG